MAVISEATAKRFWPGEDPIGKIFEVTTPEYSSGGRELFLTGSRTVQVIGIAKDVVSAWLWDGVDTTCIYLPAKAGNSAYYSLLFRVHGDPRPFVPVLRNTLASIDPSNWLWLSRSRELCVQCCSASARAILRPSSSLQPCSAWLGCSRSTFPVAKLHGWTQVWRYDSSDTNISESSPSTFKHLSQLPPESPESLLYLQSRTAVLRASYVHTSSD